MISPTKVQPRCRHAIMLLAALMMTSLSCLAYNITGHVADPDGEPLPQASVRLLKASDSTFVAGVATNLDGMFTLKGVKNGKYTVEVTYIGYSRINRDVTVQGKNVKLDTLRFSSGALALNEVIVKGVRTPVKVMEDTVEYDAGAYKTQPNAVVEDLLKRLPGVEVGTDGSITANGKTVSKILVDGKEFFSDDPKVASKNLPVEMIQKLQVVDRKSDLARLTGVDDGEDETVINLTVKPNMKNGWFGNVEGGYGTDDRYKGNFNINRMWGEGQSLTLLGNFNNINEEGFTDSNGNRFRRWGGSGGINTTQSLGLNFNVGNKEIFRVGGSAVYSHSDRRSITSRERQYLFGNDSTSYMSSATDNRNRGHNIRADFRIQWRPDSFNTLDVRPNFSLNYTDSWSSDSSLTRDGHLANVNRSLSSDKSDGNSFEGGMRVIYNHQFRQRRGRSFSIMANYRHSNVNEDETAYTESYFWRRLPYLLNDSIDIDDQVFDNHTWSDNVDARVSWTEPIGNVAKGQFLTFSYRMNYRWNNADRLVYEHPVTWPGGFGERPVVGSDLILNDTLSNRFRNDYFNQEISLGFRKVTSAYNFNAGVNIVPQMSKSHDLIMAERDIAARWVWNFSPFLRYRWKITKTRNLQADYRGRSSQPSLTQLQPVPDTSDPLRIVVGNPNLDPSYTHNVSVRFNDFNGMQQRSFMFMTNFDMTQNSIVSRTTFDPATGGQTTTYENVNGVWSGRIMGMYSQPLRNKAWSVNAHTFVMLNNRVGFNNGERNRSFTTMVNVMPGIAFRPDNLEFELRPRFSYQGTHNSISTVRTKDVYTYGGMFRAYWYMPFGVTISSDLNYSATSGYASGYDQKTWMWNASLSYQTLRDKSLTFTLRAYDLLHQQNNTSRSVSANYIDDSRFNTLTRYFMFSVAYRFNTIGKGARTRGMGDGDFGPGGRRGFGGPPPGGHGRHF